MKKVLFPLAAVLGAALACCDRQGDRPLAPDFTLKGLDGKDVSLSGFRGKPVLLSFWAVG